MTSLLSLAVRFVQSFKPLRLFNLLFSVLSAVPIDALVFLTNLVDLVDYVYVAYEQFGAAQLEHVAFFQFVVLVHVASIKD